MGTQGYLLPEFYSTKKWFIPGEDSGHASKQQVSSVQEGEFGVKHLVVLEQDGQKSLNLDLWLRYIAKFSRTVKGMICNILAPITVQFPERCSQISFEPILTDWSQLKKCV